MKSKTNGGSLLKIRSFIHIIRFCSWKKNQFALRLLVSGLMSHYKCNES